MAKSKGSTPKKTSPKKTSPKKASPKKKETKKELPKIKLPKVENIESLKPALKIVGLVFLIIFSLAVIDFAVQYLNNDLSVAVVNGVRISKNQWHERLETAYGPTVASQLIEEQIIKAEAKKSGVSVSEDAVEKEIERIVESIGGEEMFNSALSANNISLEELKDQIRMDLLATELLAPSLEYTEEEVKDFFNQYSDVIFPEETDALEEGELLNFETYKERTEEVFIQQEVQMMKASWLSEKQAEYKIQDNSTAKPKYGFLTISTNIINTLLEKIGVGETEIKDIDTVDDIIIEE